MLLAYLLHILTLTDVFQTLVITAFRAKAYKLIIHTDDILKSTQICKAEESFSATGLTLKKNCFPVLHLFLDTDSSSCLEAVPSLFQVSYINLDPFSNVRLFAFNHMVLSSACVLYS